MVRKKSIHQLNPLSILWKIFALFPPFLGMARKAVICSPQLKYLNMSQLPGESLKACDSSAENQSMDVVRSLISVHHFQIHEMPDNMVFIWDSVSPKHVAAGPGNVQSLATRVPFHQRDHLWGRKILILQSADLKVRKVDKKSNSRSLCIKGKGWQIKKISFHKASAPMIQLKYKMFHRACRTYAIDLLEFVADVELKFGGR